VPRGPTPCEPGGQVSTRAASTARARRLLAERLPGLALAALRGAGLGIFHLFPAEGPGVVARIARAPGCHGRHEVPAVAATLHLRPDATLGDALAVAGATLGGAVRLQGCTLRVEYYCPDCGRGDQRGADLVRAWPARERCGCGAVAVRPLATLAQVDRAEALRLGLLGDSLADLGVPPGSEFVAVSKSGPAGAAAVRLVLPASDPSGPPRECRSQATPRDPDAQDQEDRR
jgi:hypothetical protein